MQVSPLRPGAIERNIPLDRYNASQPQEQLPSPALIIAALWMQLVFCGASVAVASLPVVWFGDVPFLHAVSYLAPAVMIAAFAWRRLLRTLAGIERAPSAATSRKQPLSGLRGASSLAS